MGKGPKKAPSLPGPEQFLPLAQEQARLNRIQQQTPFGSVQFGIQDPKTGEFRQTTGDEIPTASRIDLAPEQQRLLDVQTRLGAVLGRQGLRTARDLDVGGFGFSGLPGVSPTQQLDFGGLPGVTDPTELQQSAEEAAFSRINRLLQPQQEQQERRLRQRLANQGLPQASEAFESELGRFERGRGEQQLQAAEQAVLTGGNLANQLFGQQLAQRQQGVGEMELGAQLPFQQSLQARGQLGQEQLAQRGLNFGESLQAIGLGAGVQPQGPSQIFAPQPVDLLSPALQQQGLTAQAQQARAGRRNDLFGGLLGGAASIGTGFAMGSSRDIKIDLGPVRGSMLDRIRDMPISRWQYKADEREEVHIGPMAEDWEAHTGYGDGRTITYVDAIGVCLKAIQELQETVDDLESRLDDTERELQATQGVIAQTEDVEAA